MTPPRDSGAAALLDPSAVLCCFAVKAEARFLANARVNRLITGIGSDRARRACQAALGRNRPELVLSCGFAGGLDPRHAAGAVLFQADPKAGLEDLLLRAGATAARFCTSERVLVTAREKRALWESSGADAVEMESEAIRGLCRSCGIPSATLRAISDTALEDLPLDFNRLLTAEQRIDYGKMCRQLLGAPVTITGLLRLRRQTRLAAKNLASVLSRVLGD